ncbi:Protein Jade-3 [Folsomia candida]|uniref:Protein Jade-3 n=1 Tax=Folsomia candida TaxID=158441 RepID=A0A226EIK0_FOLCA|nr:Protein Jade-3 [Folsomia candida]
MANDLHCPIPTCPGPSDTEDDNWIFCEQCTSWFHSKCVGVVVIPEEEWICLVCISLNSTSSQLSSTANDDPTNHPVQAETSNPTRIISSKKIYGYIWRDPASFEVVDVYFGLHEEDSKEAAKLKWQQTLRSAKKGCTDMKMFRAGYFFDHEEAFEVPGMVGTSKWVAGQLKWLTRNETGFEKKIENLTAENSTLTAENSKLSLRLKGLKRKRKDSRKVNRLLLVERRRKGGNTDVPSFIPVTFNLGADDNLVQGSLPNFDIFRDQSADDDESSSDDDDEALQYARVLKVSDLINVVTRVLDRSDTETVTSRKGDNITQETDENKQTEFSGKVFVVKLGD